MNSPKQQQTIDCQNGAWYAEIRFAPLLHLQGGLSAQEVVSIVEQTTAQGVRQTGIEAGLILCTLRNYKEAQSLQTVRLVEHFRGSRVVGFDIAADEAGFPIDEHISAFTYALDRGLHCTAHAGEARGPKSVWETLEHFRPSRIGHGVRSIEDPALIHQLAEADIHLEVCPTSNIQTNVFDRMDDHCADQLFRSGLSMSINTDARTISNVSLTDEYHTLQRLFDWPKEHFLHCNLEAMRHAFTSQEVKGKIGRLLKQAYGPT